MRSINTALLSFGMSGRVFHAPFLQLHPGFTLAGAWERSKNVIREYYPEAKSYKTLEELLADDSVELVIVNTPNYTHFEYAKAALLAGKHVIVEKPFTSTVKEAEELVSLAGQEGRYLSVYQNRRWDSDFKTVKKVINEGLLGEIVEAEIHFDRFNPILSPKQHKEVPGPGTGILHDLGPHIIDQALQLFGEPEALFADLRSLRPSSQIIDNMDILLYYPNLRVRLKGGYFVKEPLPGFILHGRNGSFLKQRADVQETELQAGMKPGNNDWGKEPTLAEGLLHVVKGGQDVRMHVPTLQGNYLDYFNGIYEALVNNKRLPVTAEEGLLVMRVIEAAFDSNEVRKVIEMAAS
ncbi:Gfo/Idh/MocA family oxidoreductase [Chitinophagaceae bacterium LB-8]|uniref:Gfo/Idh/MocA family oxidoreductase n=1 Tax=Paraflavisolibacter caeni TaxID=2982496 RepID=A0A9X3BGJ4_9BACT|nr:Gfo/Idh/MocA family oxidoreductase [Paraflavisolibacter caeni]MCU7547763.1 Gfo/Idh/MocA family oxidoreductase [Paraflavisolibacter caeni]